MKQRIIKKTVTSRVEVRFDSFTDMFNWLTEKRKHQRHVRYAEPNSKTPDDKLCGYIRFQYYYSDKEGEKGRIMPRMSDATGKRTFGASMRFVGSRNTDALTTDFNFSKFFDSNDKPLDDAFAKRFDIRGFVGYEDIRETKKMKTKWK